MTDRPDSANMSSHTTGAQSFSRAIQLLRLVAANGRSGLRLVDATRQAGLTRSTAHRLMRALEQEGLIEQDPVTERYFPGVESYILGLAAEERFGLTQSSLPFVAKAAGVSGDSCLLQIRRGDDTVCVARDEGSFPIRTHYAQPGDRHPLAVGAGGLAILSTLGDDEIVEIIDRQAELLRERYGRTSDDILRDVELTRKQGYGLNPGRVFPDSWAIGVPLVDSIGICRASLALAGIRARIEAPRAAELAQLLRDVGAECIAQWQNIPRLSR